MFKNKILNNQILNQPFYGYGFAFLLFFMSIYKYLVPVFLVLTILIWLVFENKKLNRSLILFSIPFIVLYVNYLIGMFYTQNETVGFSNLETKLILFIFPFFVLFITDSLQKCIDFIFNIFILGCVLTGIIGIISGLIIYFNTGLLEGFIGDKLSGFVHPTYYSAYLLTSMVILYARIIKGVYQYSHFKYLIPLLVFLSLLIALSASKGGIIAFFIIHFVLFIWYLVKSRHRKYIVMGMFLMIGLVAMVSYRSEFIKLKFTNALIAWNTSADEFRKDYPGNLESSAVRIMIWDVSRSAICEHPFGVGTGDVQDELNERYSKLIMLGALEKNLNCHNQFYQTTLAIGYSGLILLLLILFNLVYSAIKHRDFQLFGFFIIFLINLPFESMFESQAGITHFVIFAFLFRYNAIYILKKNN